MSRLTKHFESDLWQQGPYEWHSRYNLAPTLDVPVIRINQQGKRVVVPHRWGLVPSWAKDDKGGAKLNNARSETIAEKPSFRVPFRRYRCLVPATGYYEWQPPATGEKRKQPWYLTSAETPFLAMAGICDHWKQADGQILMTFAIVTTEAHPSISHIHDRMPVMISPQDWAHWLDTAVTSPEQLSHFLTPTDGLRTWPVGLGVSAVGANRRDDAELILPLKQATDDQ